MRFQEGSLLVTSTDSSSPGFWGTAESVTHSAEKGESLPVGFMELVPLAIRGWRKACSEFRQKPHVGEFEGQWSTLNKVRERTDLPKREASGLALGTEKPWGCVEHEVTCSVETNAAVGRGLKGHPFLTPHLQPIL